MTDLGAQRRAEPRYVGLTSGELRRRVLAGRSELERCRLCPRDCDVDRLRDQIAVCKTGRHAVVASHFPHFGEEDCLRGWRGSGTIFFAHCNLRCVFCQNYDVSQAVKAQGGAGDPPERLAERMLELQELGCHNVNFVTPEHVAPQIVEALELAIGQGLRIPIVYNTSAYDSLASLRLMDGLVDIYMPDLKTLSTEHARRWLLAADYPEAARAAILEMHRQVGDLVFDQDGLAARGLLVRHLVMPGAAEDTRAVLSFLADEVGPCTYVNVMAQYRPAGRVDGEHYQEIDRAPERAEILEARAAAISLGLRLDSRRPDRRLPAFLARPRAR